MKLETVAKMIELAGVGIRGVDIFIGHMPAERDGILLRQPFGGTPIDHELPGWLKTDYQLIVRAKTYLAGDSLIKAAIMAASTLNGVTASAKFLYMRPRHQPLNYPISPGSRFEFVVNMDACYVETGVEEGLANPAAL